VHRSDVLLKTNMKKEVWRENLNKLKAYFDEHGNFFVPLRWKTDPNFARWVENIRNSPNDMPAALNRELTKIGFSIHSASNWNIMYSIVMFRPILKNMKIYLIGLLINEGLSPF
jgi:hypothetical protein